MSLQTLLHGQDATQGQFFKHGLSDFNSYFSFSLTGCLTKAKEPNCFPIAGWKMIGFKHFPSVLVLCEMQTATSRIWTHVDFKSQ